MLIRFELENWMSFREKAEFSLVATQEKQHGDRLPRVPKYRMRILPVAAVYGGNAAGKTNLFQALHFAQKFIVRGTLPDSLIPVSPFGLDSQSQLSPTSFEITILVDDTAYTYSFATTGERVTTEKLVQVLSTGEKVLFARGGDSISWHPSLAGDTFLEYAFRGTRENQLFLTNSVGQKVERFKPVYNWFRDCLVLIAPDARFGHFDQFIDEGSPLFEKMDTLLANLDTGIVSLRGLEISLENLPFSPELKDEVRERIKEGESLRLVNHATDDRIIVTLKEGKISAKKMVATHRGSDGREVPFEMRRESDGSLRIIDLLPAFLALSAAGSRRVFVIDELERSLHSLMVRQLLEGYLDSCSALSRSQLIFTTHDLMTMDQEILRRDEMWVVERNAAGESAVTSFSEFKDIRYDRDIQKSYLEGRLGGVPHLLLNQF